MSNYDTDTISAISTGLGSAGIGIIRISGDQAINIADQLFDSVSGISLENAQSQKLYYGHIVDPNNSQNIDEVLVTVMRGPHSYTAEDVVEINCHGGIVSTRKILDLVLDSGARPAEPGEFTKRAFLNGRIDLTQAESVMDVIGAKSEKALQISVDQLSGSLKNKLKEVDADLIDLMVLIESNLDYPEYDIEEITEQKVLDLLEKALNKTNKILDQSKNSAVLRSGVKTVILGKPNVGKSSLLNLLLNDERAIVTEIPGTTRDVIQESIVIDSVPFLIIDTAGIRDTDNTVERIGVEKSLKYAKEADLVLFLRDATLDLTDDEEAIIETLDKDKTIFIANKSDLNTIEEHGWHLLSVKNEKGLEELKKMMVDLVYSGTVEGNESSLLLNERQLGLLRQVKSNLENAVQGVEAGMPEEIYAIDITDALQNLRAITGESLDSDIIDTIFERFCIGK